MVCSPTIRAAVCIDALYACNAVRVFGTEDREVPGAPIPAAARIFEYVVFQAKDILKLEFVKAEPESVRAVGRFGEPSQY
jgi:hypothetical protein